MRIRLDHRTPVPPFEQIRAQVTLHVAAGRLTAGDRLPAIRALAVDLDVSTNTVARAYRELINAGIAEAAGRRGTRITAAPPVAHQVAQRNEQLRDAADMFALAANELNASTDEAIEAIIIAIRLQNESRRRASTATAKSIQVRPTSETMSTSAGPS